MSLPSKTRAKVVKLYKAGVTLEEIQKAGVSSKAVYRALRARGKKPSRGHGWGKRKSADWGFFDAINTEEKAYWLGFLVADGYVNSIGRIQMCLSKRDSSHLQRLRRSLKSHHAVRFHRGSVVLQLCSKTMAQSLARHGMVSGKDNRFWPTSFNPVLLRHYVRGFVDGDGCFTRSPASFSVTGREKFLLELRDFVARECDLPRPRLTAARSGFRPGIAWGKRLSWGGSYQVARIAGLLYGGATVALTRKKRIAWSARSQASVLGQARLDAKLDGLLQKRGIS